MGWMADQVRSQTGRVGNGEDGMVQGSGQRIVRSHARSATVRQSKGQNRRKQQGQVQSGSKLTRYRFTGCRE
ncbi:unnamed protein product, partial [Staurois parvus]